MEQERRSTGNNFAGNQNGGRNSGGSQKQRMPFGGVASTSARPSTSSSTNKPSRRGGPRMGGSGSGPVRKPRQNRRSNMMDIDQGPSGRPVGRFPRTTAEDGGNRKKGGRGGAVAGRGGRGGKRGGAAGRGGRRGGKSGAPLNRENLDKDLDSYMMRDEKTAKTTLDQDLDDYMMGMTDIPEQIGA